MSPTESVPWSFNRAPPSAAGVGASPALRFQLRLPECGTCSKRWRGRASATAAGPEPLCLLPPLPPSPPLALQLQLRPLNERRKPARSGWLGAPGSGRASGKHSAIFLSFSSRVTTDVGYRWSPSPSTGLESIQARGGSLDEGTQEGRWWAGGELVEPGTLRGPASLEKSPCKDVCCVDQT